MKFLAILSAALLPALALAEDESTTTCTSTTTMTKTITMTNAYTTSVYADSEPTAAVVSSSVDAVPTVPSVAPEAPKASSPITVQTSGASSVLGDFRLAALAGAGAVVVALL